MFERSGKNIFLLLAFLCLCKVSFLLEIKNVSVNRRDTTNIIQNRLVNNLQNVANLGDFNYHVSLRDGNYHISGGALISDRWALTSAAKISPWYTAAGRKVFVVGSYDMREGHAYLIDIIKAHEGFRLDTLEFDIAAVRSKNTILFNQYVQPIPYSMVEINYEVDAVAVGWGWMTFEAQYLLYTNMTVLTSATCDTLWASLRPPTAICAKNKFGVLPPDSPLCYGDPGASISLPGSKILLGVMSGEQSDCVNGNGKPDIYTQTSIVADWILKTTGVDGVKTW